MIHSEKSEIWPEPFLPEPGLYLVATPIGNLRDITLRALDVLKGADVIFCEDKRVSAKLLNAYGIKKPLHTYHDHSSEKDRQDIIDRLKRSEVIALISDAGMPMISDPGYKLVRECKKEEQNIYSIPGPNAALAALQLSGLPTDQFSFYGFMPSKQKAMEDALKTIKNKNGVHVYYDTASRLTNTLVGIKDVLSDRICCVARELTKKFENVQTGTASDLLEYYEDHPLKGEIVLLVSGAQGSDKTDREIDQELKEYLKTESVKDAASLMAEDCGLSKNDLYKRALRLKNAK